MFVCHYYKDRQHFPGGQSFFRKGIYLKGINLLIQGQYISFELTPVEKRNKHNRNSRIVSSLKEPYALKVYGYTTIKSLPFFNGRQFL